MNPWALAADALLALHAGIVLFVVGGLLYVWAGHGRGWRGARSWGLRLAHLAAIGIVAAQAWLGRLCPLTIWEMALRQRAGGRFLIDDEVLAQAGVTDLSGYAVDPSQPLLPDLFLD